MISVAVTAKLICVFVFAYADYWFSHEAAHIAVVCKYLSGNNFPETTFVRTIVVPRKVFITTYVAYRFHLDFVFLIVLVVSAWLVCITTLNKCKVYLSVLYEPFIVTFYVLLYGHI